MNAASLAAHLTLLAVIFAAVKVVIVPALAEAHRNGVERLRNTGYAAGTSSAVGQARRRRNRKLAVARKLRKKGLL